MNFADFETDQILFLVIIVVEGNLRDRVTAIFEQCSTTEDCIPNYLATKK